MIHPVIYVNMLIEKVQAYPLLMVWNNASDKVGLGVVQCGHEFGQRLLVELSHCAEHSLLGL